jgi:hypothetical protein
MQNIKGNELKSCGLIKFIFFTAVSRTSLSGTEIFPEKTQQ